jgi:hypothetical protein
MTALDRVMTIGALVLALGVAAESRAQSTVAPAREAGGASPTSGIYPLEQFGAVDTAAGAQETFDKAAKAISAAGGGTIIIPRSAAADWHTHTAPQPMLRVPDPPAPAAKWGTHPGVSVYDLRTPDTFYTAQTSGIKLTRRLLLPMGQTIPEGIDAQVGSINQELLRGTASYGERALADVPAGAGKTVSLPSIQGLFPGIVLVFGGKEAPGTFSVKSLDFDKATRTWTATGDLSKALSKGELLECVTRSGTLNLTTYSQNENQTFDMMIWHQTYGISSRNLVKASMKYQGDNIPSPGGRGSVLFGAYTEQLTHPFEGHVESFNGETGALVYKKEALATDTLGSGRPIINLNPAKQIHSSALIYGDWGSVELLEDTKLPDSLTGWYMAVDEPGEQVPGTNARRWWPIAYKNKQKDGKASLGILRYWWGAHAGRGVGEMYTDIISTKEKDKPVKILLAPGALVYDASEGFQRPEKNQVNPKRLLKIAPRSYSETTSDFEPGDAITQAIGPDPWHPAIFRSWLFESVPGIGPNPIFDVQNNGPIPRGSVMHVHGGSRYNTYMSFQTGASIGIRFQRDVPGGALVFNAAPANAKSPLANGIAFVYPDQDKKPTYAGLGADQTGRIKLWGKDQKGTNLGNQNVSGVTGLNSESGNLRGIALPVAEGKTSHQITFAKAEISDEYALIVRPNWITNYSVQTKNAEGVTVVFDKPAPKDATLDWLLVR